MSEFENISIEIPASIGQLYDKHLPDPDLLQFYKQLGRREIVLNQEVNDDISGFSFLIREWNLEDYGKPVEERKPIKFFINTDGGDMTTMYFLSDVISTSKTPVYTIGMSRCYSAGGILLMSGKKRFVFKNTSVLIHDGYVDISGPAGKSSDTAEFCDQLKKNTLQFIIEHTNITKKKLEENYRKDWFIYSEDIIKYGIADEIITNLEEI